MSTGIFKSKKEPESHYFHVNPKENLSPDVFEKVKYIPENSGIIEAFDIPKESIPELNKIAGRFFRTIQEGSFVSEGTWGGVPDFRIYDRTGTCSPRLASYTSTLPALNLLIMMRQELHTVVREIVPLLGEKNQKIQNILKNVPELEKKYHPTPNLLLSAEDEEVFNDAPLLANEIRASIEEIRKGCSKIIEETLRSLAKSILSRAHLSTSSMLCDIGFLKNKQGDKNYREAEYSTLNPEDFIEMMREHLHNFLRAVGIGLTLAESRTAEQ